MLQLITKNNNNYFSRGSQIRSHDMKDQTVDELLNELNEIVNTLKDSMVKEAPLFISKSIDPARALHLREACFHCIMELSDSAYDEFRKGNLVAGYLLARAVMETLALFRYFVDQVRDALKNGDVEEVRVVLSKMLVGTKVKLAKESIAKVMGKTVKEMEITLNPLNVLTLVDHVAKEFPSFRDCYDFLSEVSHPNAAGLVKSYVRIDRDSEIVYFGKDQGKFGSHLEADIQALSVSLEYFIDLYDESAELLTKFQEISKANPSSVFDFPKDS